VAAKGEVYLRRFGFPPHGTGEAETGRDSPAGLGRGAIVPDLGRAGTSDRPRGWDKRSSTGLGQPIVPGAGTADRPRGRDSRSSQVLGRPIGQGAGTSDGTGTEVLPVGSKC
jgi:hypothetical protein